MPGKASSSPLLFLLSLCPRPLPPNGFACPPRSRAHGARGAARPREKSAEGSGAASTGDPRRMWKSLPVLRKVNGSSRDISAEKLLLRRHSGASGSQRKPPPRQTSVAVTAGRRRWSQWADRSSGRDAGGLRSRQSATGTPSSVASPGVRLLGLIPSQSAGTLPRFKLSSGGRHGPAPRALHLHLPRETLDGPVLNLTWVAAGGWEPSPGAGRRALLARAFHGGREGPPRAAAGEEEQSRQGPSGFPWTPTRVISVSLWTAPGLETCRVPEM
ncbi:uncharacterized protein LOC135580698 isoform X2 [Columba livia]|uniref:uncharacterized protein LOC135580698 isoform X2 n=1 Tax=Columba livia TaxID=8932 RepID=UPI0031B9C8FA